MCVSGNEHELICQWNEEDYYAEVEANDGEGFENPAEFVDDQP